MTVCNRVIEAEPNFLPGLILMGDLLMQTGKLQDASEMFARASTIQPSNLLLRDKIARLNSLLDRQVAQPAASRQAAPAENVQRPAPPSSNAARPGVTQTAVNGQRPAPVARPSVAPKPSASAPPTAATRPAPPPPAAKPQEAPKSIFDKLLNRK